MSLFHIKKIHKQKNTYAHIHMYAMRLTLKLAMYTNMSPTLSTLQSSVSYTYKMH